MNHVLIFSTAYLPLIGGAEVAMKEITDRLPDIHFDLYCAKIQRGLPTTERIGNVMVHRVGFGHRFDKFLLPIIGPLWALIKPSGSEDRIVWSLLASYGGFAALVYTWLMPRTNMVLTLQEGDPLEHYAQRAGWFTSLHKQVFVRANVVHAISKFLGDWAVKMGFKGTPIIIPNGVDVERFAKRISTEERQSRRAALGVAPSDVVLVTVSRLSLKNGVDDLIRSLTKLPSAYKALLIGEGEDRQKLEVLTQQKELKDRVIFLGAKDHSELPALLQASDVFVRPSLSEALGNSFLEAMAAGVPIVGTPVGGIPDFLMDGETGVFCQPRDPDSIAQAVMRIQTEAGLKEKIVEHASRIVKEKYEWNQIADQIGSMLEKTV